MDKEKACLVIHPKAEQHAAAVVNILEERWDTTSLVTQFAGHGMAFAENAPVQNYRWIIALGGDGTLNEVVNGSMRARRPCIVGILPGGTANQWAHEIGLPEHPLDAARALLQCTPRSVDVGSVEVQALDFPQETLLQQETVSRSGARHHFLLTAGFGLDATVIRATTESAKQQYHQLAFFLDWLEMFPQIQPFSAHIQWSSQQVWEGHPREVLVSNTRRYANVVDVAPEAYVNDGLLDIRILSYVDMLFHYVQDRSFSLRVPAPTPMHLDGSSVQLEDYLSQENHARLQTTTETEKVMVTYRFSAKPAALLMAIPRGYAGDLFSAKPRSALAESSVPPQARISTPEMSQPPQKSEGMAYRATRISQDPLTYFLRSAPGSPLLHVADVVVRENKDPKEIFAHMIRLATGSKWSHAALLYPLDIPSREVNTILLIESRTKGTRLATWREEVVPFDLFTVGIKRPCLEWYAETSEETARNNYGNTEYIPGIDYLKQVGGIAMDQIDGLYDNKTVYELGALYLERVATRYLGAVPQDEDSTTRFLGAVPYVEDAAAAITNIFKQWRPEDAAAYLDKATRQHIVPYIGDAATAITEFLKQWQAADYSPTSIMRFICSGLVQYSLFEALRRCIANDIAIPAHRDAAMHNLEHMHRIIIRPDHEGVIPAYVQQVRSGKRAITDPVPEQVLNLLKTAVPADFNNSPNLEWQYVILKGAVWRISKAPADYTPQSQEEEEVLAMISPEHRLNPNNQ
jgi:YegS/Rv2252/BmrU family lipid kinase